MTATPFPGAPGFTPSATTLINRLNNCVAPFDINLSAAAGILLWFLLFFLIADICPPFFVRYACRTFRGDGCGR